MCKVKEFFMDELIADELFMRGDEYEEMFMVDYDEDVVTDEDIRSFELDMMSIMAFEEDLRTRIDRALYVMNEDCDAAKILRGEM